jgi:3-phenylpropionate/trans-cinnamate dioxygenase ferredoxin subunit
VDVATTDDIPAGKATRVSIHAGTVALFNVAGQLFAIDDACIRCGASLSDGALAGTRVVCPGCGWGYDVVTGCVEGVPSLRTDTFKVTVVGAHVEVDEAPRIVPR